MNEEKPSSISIIEFLSNNRSAIFGLLFFILIIFISVIIINNSNRISEPTQEIDQSIQQEELTFQNNKIEIGKIIQKTVQSDPCIEDIVKGVPQESWRCNTPEAESKNAEPINTIIVQNKKAEVNPLPTNTIQIIEQVTELETQEPVQTINWDEAFYYVDELAVICGPVVDSYYAASTNGQPTFLNIGREYPDPDRFTALIWGSSLEAFPFNPDEYYLGKTVCIKGVIEEYEGMYEIEVRRPEQIEVR